jgi:hypothetical protein
MFPFVLYSKCVRCKDNNIVMKNRIFCDECLTDIESIRGLEEGERAGEE